MITIQAKHLSTLKEAMVGLLSARAAYPVYFQTRWGIHTFGMKFPIDILILDSLSCVVRMEKSMKPNRVFFWPPSYFRVIEVPSGYIEKHTITIGEKISIEYV